MKDRARKGFTLVELLVVVVLGSVVVLSAYQVLTTTARVYAVNGARALGQQTLRGAVEILSNELREISTPGGDLITMSSNSLRIRAQRAFGVVCNVDYSAYPPQLTAFRIGPAFQAGDSVLIYHDNDPDISSDDVWHGGPISAVDTTVTCQGNPAQVLSLPFVGTVAAGNSPDSVRAGAPMRGFEIYTYGEVNIDGDTYLGRQGSGNNSVVPLIGPVQPEGGISFRYLDDVGDVTTVESDVAQIEVTIRYLSSIRTAQNEPVTDSLVVRVYPRN
jgi:prepilin-type N-terminal cleavage/methylation domain-containing protein